MVKEMKQPNQDAVLAKKLGYSPYLLNSSSALIPYLQQGEEGKPFVQIGLEKIFQDMGVKDTWIARQCTDLDSMAKAIQAHSESYKLFKNQQTIESLALNYSKEFEKYSQGGTDRLKTDSAQFLGVTYESLGKKIKRLAHDIAGAEFGKISKEDAEKLKKEQKEWKKVKNAIDLAEQTSLLDFDKYLKFTAAQKTFNVLYPIKEQEKKAA